MNKNGSVELFGKWSLDETEISDLGLKRYISLKPILLPHSMGRHEHGRFRKASVNIVERLVNFLMRPGASAGKKTRAINIVKNAFELIHLRTGQNPVTVFAQAVQNSAPSEDTTRVSYGGVVYHLAVDISPQRRIDLALRFISEGSRKAAFGTPITLEECLAEELLLAANNDVKSYAVAKRHEMERIARSSR